MRKPKEINPYNLPRGLFTEDDKAGLYPGIEHHPPWQDDNGNDIDTGTRSTYNQQWRDYDARGFWQYHTPIPRETQQPALGVRGGLLRGTNTPYDYALMTRYLEHNSVQGLQYDAYLLVVVQGMSITAAAKRLQIQRQNLRQDLKRLQSKAERWLASHQRMHDSG
jgi:hypothetical protein